MNKSKITNEIFNIYGLMVECTELGKPLKHQSLEFVNKLNSTILELKQQLAELKEYIAVLEQDYKKVNKLGLEPSYIKNTIKENEQLKAKLNSYEEFYKTNGFKSKDDVLDYVINTMRNKEDNANEIRELKAEVDRLKMGEDFEKEKKENALKLVAELKAENESYESAEKIYLNRLKNVSKDHDEIVNKLKQQLKEKDKDIIHYKEEEQKYKREIARRDKKIENQRKELKEKDEEIAKNEKDMREMNIYNDQLRNENDKLKAENVRLKADVNFNTKQVCEKIRKYIDHLLNQLDDYEEGLDLIRIKNKLDSIEKGDLNEKM